MWMLRKKRWSAFDDDSETEDVFSRSSVTKTTSREKYWVDDLRDVHDREKKRENQRALRQQDADLNAAGESRAAVAAGSRGKDERTRRASENVGSPGKSNDGR